MKKTFLYLSIIVLIVITHLFVYKSVIIQNLDYKIYDLSKELLGKSSDISANSNVVIVDIDEKSLASLGQWPWSRLILTKLISEISSYKPASISLDIIFPEKDRSSPSQITAFYKNYLGFESHLVGIPKSLWDNDAIFASQLKKSDAVLSFYLSHNYMDDNRCSKIMFDEFSLNALHLESYPYLLCNTPQLLDSLSHSGYINTRVDDDGILRRYATFKQYKDKVVPSLALATLLNVDREFKVINSTTLNIMDKQIEIGEEATLLLNFYNKEWYKKLSALDLLKKNLDSNLLLGKIIIIGSSAAALHDQVIIAPSRNIAGVQVHATMIDNLLRNEFLMQPKEFKSVNILLSFFLTMILFLLLVKKENNYIVILFLGTSFLSAGTTLYMLSIGTYISIGYLIIPFLIHFFLISILFIFIDTYDRKVFSEELNRSHIALVDSMAYVAEIHDLETGAHIIRTKKYIEVLGEHILLKGIYSKHISPSMIRMMYATAPMHDIGKVGIPDAILKKEGRLTAMEYEVMKTHPDLGMHIINNAISAYKSNDFFEMARNIAHYHHEKWDGTGYPKGLKGEEIPLEARFMAISDVYDALISRRVYKEPFSYTKTVEIIKERRGTAFDPLLVDAFLEITDKFENIAERYGDSMYNG
jgi:adenylate cyclase